MSDRRMANTDPSLPTVVMFGDSLTEYSFFLPSGTGNHLTHSLANRVNVLNFGFAGRTSESLRSIFTDHIIARLPGAPLLFTIWLGANDATLGFANVPIDDFERYLRDYVGQVVDHPTWSPKPKVLLITPPPINVGHFSKRDEDGDDEDSELDLGPAMTRALEQEREAAKTGIGHRTWLSKREYAKRVMQISNSYSDDGVSGLDLWTRLTQTACEERGAQWVEDKLPGCGLPGSKSFPDGYFTDGLHFGGKGYEIVTKVLVEKIEQTWPDLLPGLH